ncbi:MULTISPECIES: hypothetical protein [unclassified Imperialibacter]|uniref:hypothetical protein n=1 Tax=unclassified Imperialibacter TaxID=2629706 RepID=UPI001255ED0C|nr:MULTISPECIES: hypothetical protein [unclassified Imperialibacter]CAD5253898.1 conserved hypothetical protein [Imperialibacter sp. 75]CAD5262266.1 conserved hypothetical protein [Imperialibacter sp. 89]VVT35217.1 conserved hypothetical protein [Imperialibacter sp. EC-SDR9]
MQVNRYFVGRRNIDMNIEARKLRIIEAFSSMKDIGKINQIESLVLPKPTFEERKAMLDTLSGSWTNEEAEDVKKVIEDGCEKIDTSEW